MNDDSSLNGLFWATRLPVQLRINGHVDDAATGDWDWDSSDLPALFDERLLKVLSSGEEQTGSAWSDDPDIRARQRLEAKIDLLMAAMAWQDQAANPLPVRTVELHEEGLRVLLPDDEAGDFDAGQSVRVSLRLDAAQPFPLSVNTRLASLEPGEGGCQLTLLYRDVDVQLQDLMVKFIFRQHRRQVASTRRELGDE